MLVQRPLTRFWRIAKQGKEVFGIADEKKMMTDVVCVFFLVYYGVVVSSMIIIIIIMNSRYIMARNIIKIK